MVSFTTPPTEQIPIAMIYNVCCRSGEEGIDSVRSSGHRIGDSESQR